ncbi:cysteine desulfurase family protein [Lignipirellula cremea]|uniref:cysteine desulfurase n=2 Tax=Lignipirellula cremea TaxID=2528010 RepID=A0A518DSH5_9BACT|nr:aminotransferase class V-fold PLP-dependent enzyme [Lignipirellula cremea]QDU94791.1 Cysteine desulfurase [Lignipirellula cremea]
MLASTMSNGLPLYLDNHSTTRVDPRVVAAMLPMLTENYGNAGSVSHPYGWEAAEAVNRSRETIAAAIQAKPREIVFTSGATESNNLAIRGIAEHPRRQGDQILSVATEHKAVLDPLARLQRRLGLEIRLLPVAGVGSDCPGRLDPQQVADAITDRTALVSVMLANNEIGVIQPLAEIGAICRERGVPLHCDATQALGKIPIDARTLNVDLMSFSAHKLYGPKGVGCLYIRRGAPRLRLEPQIDGGGQEQNYRSGTLNTAGIVGFAKAVELCLAEMPTESVRLRGLRDRLFERLETRLDRVVLNGPPLTPELRLDNNLNCSFALVDGEALMMSMGELAVSSGSACTSTNPEPSHVLRAIGLSDDATRSSLRFGLGRFNTEQEIDRASDLIVESVARLRKMSSMA